MEGRKTIEWKAERPLNLEAEKIESKK